MSVEPMRERVRRQARQAVREASESAFALGRYYEQGVQLGSTRQPKPLRERRVRDRGLALLEDRRDGAARAAYLLQGYTDATSGVA